MTDSVRNHEPENNRDADVNAAQAAHLLDVADQVSIRVNEGTDFRIAALILGWGAAALFIYVAAFLLLFTAPGQDGGGSDHIAAFLSPLLIAILVQSQLIQGARNRILISLGRPLRSWKLWLQLFGFVLFVAVAAASLFGLHFSWWVSFVVAIFVTAPLGIASLSSARKAREHPARTPLVSPRSPLSGTARVMTAGLGAYFGLAGAMTLAPRPWSSIVNLLLILIVVGLMIGWNARWGLPRVSSEWGLRPWAAHGTSFTLLVTLTVVVARTSWASPWIAATGGILIALPLLVSALPQRHAQ
jgi:hypothetical protein